MAGLNDKSAFEAFDRMAEKIEESERMVAASVEVHEAITTGDTLEREFKALGAVAGEQTIEWKLLQLKEKMQLGTGSNAKPQQALKPGAAQPQPHNDIVKDAVLEDEA
jgi:phage shock protein A